MQVGSDRIICLLKWCTAHGVRVDPRLEIREGDKTGITVFSREEYIPTQTTCENYLLCRSSVSCHQYL
jgi:hypothetical protein